MKRSTARLLSVLCFLAVLLSVFAGCGGNSSEAPDPSGSGVDSKEITEIKNGKRDTRDFMCNPLGVQNIGDPFILLDDDGTYYMYATSIGTGFKVWESTICGTWADSGKAYQKNATSWGNTNYWAPEVYKVNGKYYMFYSAQYNIAAGVRYAIGCAVSDSPLGPFTDLVANTPLFKPDYSVIDASVFFDDDGACYLIFSKDCSENIVRGKYTSESYGVRLSPDFLSVIGEPVKLTTPDVKWETATGNHVWNEGPCLLKHNGIYYLMYSGGVYTNNTYSVGYATSDAPLGTYKKYAGNPILHGDGKTVTGTGHNNYFHSPDGTEIYTVYHTLVDPTGTSKKRQLCIDRLIFAEDGTLSVNGPTTIRLPLPSGTQGMFRESVSDLNITAKIKKGSADALCDGILDPALEKKTKNFCSFQADSGSVNLTYTGDRPLKYLFLYPDGKNADLPQSADALINGKYLVRGMSFVSDESPVILCFDNLPDGVRAESIELRFTPADGSSVVALKEITLVSSEKE